MTVEDVLATPAEYDHVLEVRSIGPAVVLVLEREAPMRLETLASTEAEFDALREWVASHPQVFEVLSVYFEGRTNEEGGPLFAREDAHAHRLSTGRRLSALRVNDPPRRIRLPNAPTD